MEMKLFQYREQKATKKKKNPNMRDGVLAVVVLLMTFLYGFGLWNSRTSNQLDKSSLLSILW